MQLCIEPGLVAVAYLGVVAWVGLCVYLIILHGLALNDSTQRFWAWAVACFVSLTHELLVQQVMALLLKLVVNQRLLPRKSDYTSQLARTTSLSESVSTAGAPSQMASEGGQTSARIVPFTPEDKSKRLWRQHGM